MTKRPIQVDPKRAEFHQAIITAQIRIVDDDRSYDLKTAQVTVLLNTSLDWIHAIDQVDAAIAELTQQLAQQETPSLGDSD